MFSTAASLGDIKLQALNFCSRSKSKQHIHNPLCGTLTTNISLLTCMLFTTTPISVSPFQLHSPNLPNLALIVSPCYLPLPQYSETRHCKRSLHMRQGLTRLQRMPGMLRRLGWMISRLFSKTLQPFQLWQTFLLTLTIMILVTCHHH